MPAIYAIHICEEWFGGFPQYIADAMGGSVMPGLTFWINNSVFMAILVTLTAWASRRPSRASVFALMSWASANLFWNFVVHLYYTVVSDKFSPGLVTATFVYYPLPILVSFIAIREGHLTGPRCIGAFAIGAALMLFVIWGGIHHFAI
ncbi:MAG: HXXEE domain-containing protein [Burkholderiales bacterium]|nr:HXXEE domain-containing protein [Burkholderiales bacterium]